MKQRIVTIGLLKKVKGRWSCLPLAFRFYLLYKDIRKQSVTTGIAAPHRSGLFRLY